MTFKLVINPSKFIHIIVFHFYFFTFIIFTFIFSFSFFHFIQFSSQLCPQNQTSKSPLLSKLTIFELVEATPTIFSWCPTKARRIGNISPLPEKSLNSHKTLLLPGSTKLNWLLAGADGNSFTEAPFVTRVFFFIVNSESAWVWFELLNISISLESLNW